MNSKGFTLLEVILVCLVLGIVSVVVMPRILNLQNDARIAVVEKTFSSFQEAIRFSHAKWQVNGEGNTAISNMYGYGPPMIVAIICST
ncbi:prepilin-type N-terminal cleavage/methylation domain-containing protein [Vibrio natriegens]|uniref:type II secretion system protein n=1 Tax=Vibrio natriegens TaxID=691 RepID=UPI0009C0F3D3